MPNRFAILNHGADGSQILGIETELGMNSFSELIPRLEENSIEYVVTDMTNDNYVNARIITDKVLERSRTDEIWLIGHSMGCLSARYALKFYGILNYVKGYIAVDGPQFGDKRPLLNLQLWPTSYFMQSLNSGDPTPGNIEYYQLMIYYQQKLPGAICLDMTRPDLTGRTGHRDAIKDDMVLDTVMKMVLGEYEIPFVG